MRIRGFTDDDFQPYIGAYLICPLLGEKAFPILFLVDTGASITTILAGDAKRIGINYKKLKKSKLPTIGIGGFTDTYELPDVTLVFEKEKGEGRERFHAERLEKIDVVKQKEDEKFKLPISVLGTDVLSRFKVTYDKDYIYLEK